MLKLTLRNVCVASVMLAAAAAGLSGLFGGHAGRAEAQGLMSVPACQCSPTTPVAGISTTLVHCICGGISCVITEHKEQGKNTNLMQCVK
jgi:hypothetical protein